MRVDYTKRRNCQIQSMRDVNLPQADSPGEHGKNSPAPIVCHYYCIFQISGFEEICQGSHMQLEVDELRDCDLITPAMPQPIHHVDLVALVHEMSDDL